MDVCLEVRMVHGLVHVGEYGSWTGPSGGEGGSWTSLSG